MRKLSLSLERRSNLCARVDNALSVVILATEHLRLLDEQGEEPVALGGLARVLDGACHDLMDIRDDLNPNTEDE